MKILAIYPNREGYGRVPLGLSLIITLLQNAGHRVEIFDTTFLSNGNIDSSTREELGFVLQTDMSFLYESYTSSAIDELFRAKVKEYSPDLIAVSIVEDNYRYAHRLLKVAKSISKNITVLAGGSTPTVAPHIVIENPYIDYLIQGDGEEAVVEFCKLMERGKSVEGVRNLWYLKEGVAKGNPLRPQSNMDSLPIQNLGLWDERHFIKPYCGELYKSGYYEMSRGCVHKCTYCINHSLENVLRDAGRYFRRKTIDKLVLEIKMHLNEFKWEMIFFCDDNFLSMSTDSCIQFSRQWKDEINIPFWVNTTAESVNARKLEHLKDAGCNGISIGIESGSEWLRENILNRKIKNDRIIKTFKLIHEYGIRTSSNILIGFPGEYEEDVFESIKLAKMLQTNNQDVTFVTPYMGTNIHAIAFMLGYITISEEPGFRGFAEGISMRRPSIKVPQLSTEFLEKIYKMFMGYVNGKIPIPRRFMNSAPGADSSALPRGEWGKDVSDKMKELILSMSKGISYEEMIKV